jgi:hypothetical protein
MRLMRRNAEDSGQEIRANRGDALSALDALPLLAIGVALGVAGVLVTAFLAKILSSNPEG